MMQYFLDYTHLFITKLVSVSFPFLLFSNLLIQYGIIEFIPRKNPYIVVFILSLLSGFPSGAQYTKSLLEEKNITIEEGNQILKFSHFPNPLFVIGSVQIALGNLSLSLKILLAIILSNFLILLFSKKEKKMISYKKKQEKSFSKILSSSIVIASKTILLVYGTSLFFSSFFILITKYLHFSSYLFVLNSGLFDLTKGVFATTILKDVTLRSYFILFFISLGGIPIHIQVKSILEDTPLSYHSFLKGRLLGTILSFLFFTLTMVCLPQ